MATPFAMVPLAQNTTSYIPFGTHLATLKPIPVIPSCFFTIYNHEGVPRCHKCLCLQLRPHSHQRDCPGPRSQRPSGFTCLAGCGRVSTTSAYAASHSTKCEGAKILRDRYGTCICPKCEMAGFAEKAIQKHISKCRGERADTLRAYGGARAVHYCEGCGGCFLGVGLRSHTCHVMGDPAWLGNQDGPPGLSITYVRWRCQNYLTLGGVPGQMPECIPDETVSEPLTRVSLTETSGNVATDGQSSSWEHDIDWDVASDLDSADDGMSERDSENTFTSKSLYGEDGTESEAQEGAASKDARRQEQGMGFEYTSDDGPLRGCDHEGTGDSAAGETGGNRDAVRGVGLEARPLPLSLLEHDHGGDGILSEFQSIWRPEAPAPAAILLPMRVPTAGDSALGPGIQVHGGRCPPMSPGRMSPAHRGAVALQILHADQVVAWNDPPRRTLTCPLWTLVKDALQKTGVADAKRPVFFIDTESLYESRRKCFLVCELAVRSASNDVLLDTLVDHGLTYRDLQQRVRPEMWGKLVRMYGFQQGSSRTRGMAPSQVSDALARIGMGPSAVVVEWSLQGFDLHALRQTFADGIFPPRSLLGHRLWRDIGLPGSVALLPLFASMFPDSHLRREHHRASVDCEKLFLVVATAMQCFV
ncbi:hypothetical protein CHU98_g9395 [Xylaria longipes]|nr:hypothetical protein CHU98_g9395 [Xylaria longipes]